MQEQSVFQKTFDQLWARTVIPFIPLWITPNMISIVRILLLPLVAYYFITAQYLLGGILFSIAAITDSLDGSLARTRGPETERGRILDPIADRGLIAVALFTLIPPQFGWWLVILMIVLEMFNALMAYRSSVRNQMHPHANWAGKAKMIVESIAFGVLALGLILTYPTLITVSFVLLLIGLALTFLEGFLYP